MNATDILWGQVIPVSAVVPAFVWGAAERTAWRGNYDAQAGGIRESGAQALIGPKFRFGSNLPIDSRYRMSAFG
jgi:hypothetical protein